MKLTGHTVNYLWEFPGGAWGIAGVLCIGLLIIALSYFFAVKRLQWWKITILTLLRLGVMAGLVFCLCNPRREEVKKFEKDVPRKLAVAFDTSSSMRLDGILGASRLKNVLELWKRSEKQMPDTEYRYYRFDESWGNIPRPEPLADLPVKVNDKSINTHFYDFIRDASPFLEKSGVTGLICFTDGVDTSENGNLGDAIKTLRGSSLKYIFVPAATELAMRRFIEFRKVECPTKALPDTKTPVTVAVGYCNLPVTENLSLEVVKKGNPDQVIFNGKDNRRSMAGTAIFRFEIANHDLGTASYEARLKLNGNELAASTWSIQTVKRERRNVLLFLGTYDWSVRFLKYSLGSNGRTNLDVRIPGEKNIATKNFFPSREEMKNYDTIIIMNVERRQINAEIESRLRDYLNNGGGVIFITGNPVAAGEFANSELENLLPVEFDNKLAQVPRSDESTTRFFEEARKYRNANMALENILQEGKEHSFNPDKLKPFELTPSGSENMIFRDGQGNPVIPEFSDFAYVKDVKPGASALAFHHDKERGDCIIMATQRFGQGRSVVIATDPLWRWKLSQPSANRNYDIFWENLVGWTGGAGEINSATWQLSNRHTAVGKPIPVKIKLGIGFNEKIPDFAVKKDGRVIPLELKQKNENGVWEGEFTPQQPGVYVLRAPRLAEASFTAAEIKGDRELDAPAPDLYFFKTLAEANNVRTLADIKGEIDLNEYFNTPKLQLIEKREYPLWCSPWLIILMLGCFAAELILRRIYNMI